MVTGTPWYYGTGQFIPFINRTGGFAVGFSVRPTDPAARPGIVLDRFRRPRRVALSSGSTSPLSASRRGQSLVEFALVLPMLLVLLLGIADFGRAFQASITIEAATRDGAEAGAIERLRNHPPAAGDPGEIGYYDDLHRVAALAACSEAKVLGNTTLASDGTCPSMPVMRVCIHDGQDPQCGKPIPGFGSAIPVECTAVADLADHPNNASPGEPASHTVEVRLCYRFTTLFNLHLALPFNWGLSLGDVWLQRTREFAVDCPPGGVASC